MKRFLSRQSLRQTRLWTALLLLFATTVSAQVNFIQTRSHSGDMAWQVLTEDLNGDAHPDLVVRNRNTQDYENPSFSVAVLFNDGNGDFGSPATYSFEEITEAIAVGDLDQDGHPDLGVLLADESYNGIVAILTNEGDGTFSKTATYSVGSESVGIVINDLNNDDAPDIVTLSFNGEITVLFNQGNGTFDSGLTYPVGAGVNMAVGDLDGDGYADLAVSNGGANVVSIVLNQGDGTFGARDTYPTGDYAAHVVMGDLDYDGAADLVVANRNSNNLSVLLNNGDGTFSPHVLCDAGDNPGSAGIGDLNGDGSSDLAIVNRNSATVSVLLNNGDGTFASQVITDLDGSPTSLAMDDFNDDGRLDIVVAHAILNDNITVLMNSTVGASITPDESNILYVDINVDTAAPGYTGAGDSWANAIPQPADALKWAREQYAGSSPGWNGTNPLRIYVAVGTYQPAYHAGDENYAANGDRLNSFVLVPDVQLYGGFDPANGVVSLEDTRILPDADNPGLGTVLSGDLNSNDDDVDFSGHLENVHHVVIAAGDLGVGGIDGFTIGGGAASGDPVELFTVNGFSVSSEAGGGMFTFFSSPSLTDCLFSRNRAVQGGGMSNVGAVSIPSLVRCTFRGNYAENGGGMVNLQAAPLLTTCVFLENSAEQGGGGMYNMMANPSITVTIFKGNSADAGGGMANDNSTPLLDQCDFIENTARNGGGMMNGGGTVSLTRCAFSENSATADGGGMHDIQGVLMLTGCTFSENSADQRGGAMRNDRSSVTLRNSKIMSNTAPQGGGINNESCTVVSLTNTQLSGNSAMMGAAMISGICDSVVLTNCTISDNTASMMGGGLTNVQSPTTLANVIIWDNEVNGDVTAPEVSLYTMSGGELPVISHSLIANWGGSNNWDGTLGVDGGGNLDADPLFIDPANSDYRLQTCSPAINKGDNALLDGAITVDADGNPRTVHTIVDMGAFEYQEAFPAGNLALHHDESTKNINGSTDFFGNDESCRLIARVAPAGADPVSGSVTARVEIDPEVAFHNASPYVQRHYLINAHEGGSASVTLYFTQDEFDNFNNEISDGYLPTSPGDHINRSNLRVYQFHGEAGSTPADYESPLTVVAPQEEDIVWNDVSGRWEVSFSVEGFSGFFIGSVASPLPVRLVSFSGSKEGEKLVALHWEVVEQQNIKTYEVEFSTDGLAFDRAGTVPATRTTESHYSFRHIPPSAGGIAYYRLRILEADGSAGNSNIITVRLADRPLVSVYPVPANDLLFVEGPAITGTKANLINMHGVVTRTWTFSSGKQQLDINTLPSGIYFLRLQDGTLLKVVKK